MAARAGRRPPRAPGRGPSRRGPGPAAPAAGRPPVTGGGVYLVGAGPGEPGLLTVRGLELIRTADVIVYDRLVNPALLDEAPPAALRIFAGKAAGAHCLPQAEINALLIA